MGILPDFVIRQLAEDGMISPFEPKQVKTISVDGVDSKAVSFGVSSYGYDARLSPEFKVFTPVHNRGSIAIMDPKAPDPHAFVDVTADELIIPPHGYVLARTIETFNIPRDVLAICVGKSTYARSGLMVNVTPLEPGWPGEVTLELGNLLPIPLRVYAYEGICQFLFLQGTAPCETSYADRAGKYMHQRGVTPAK